MVYTSKAFFVRGWLRMGDEISVQKSSNLGGTFTYNPFLPNLACLPFLAKSSLSVNAVAIVIVLALILHFEPHYGQTNILVYLGICSLMGSLTGEISQVAYPQTWFFVVVAVICVITQLNYLNRALDSFNTAIVSPIYYVMFTTLTIIASAIMFKDCYGQDVSSITSKLCGFITVLSGTIILHSVREQEPAPAAASISWYISRSNGDLMKHAGYDTGRV
ncbi:probable magnesium transporter NIPA6 [Magnolia sinica]|uniref:probable magnesium transporter NIPA6 n=1 Tax=Magnolia sinica TaxID=86752 RepID=UPI00265A02C0|nr:probable magnesium transporter NIPA6 [Magnolia sinica]